MAFYDLNMNSKRITSCQDPSGVQDVATKNYVDTTSGLVFIKSQTIPTNVSSVIITNAFSATYDNYLINITNADTVSGTYFLEARLRTGSTDISSGYYTAGYTTSAYAGVLSTSFVNNGSSWNVAGIGPNSISGSTFTVYRPFLASPTSYSSNYAYDSGTGRLDGYQSSSTSFDQFVLLSTAGGTLNGGTVKVYGFKN
jgi:hypothetical protein